MTNGHVSFIGVDLMDCGGGEYGIKEMDFSSRNFSKEN